MLTPPTPSVTRRRVLGGLVAAGASGLVPGGATAVAAAGRTFVAIDAPVKFILKHDVDKAAVRRPTSATRLAEHPLDDCRTATFYEYEVDLLAADCAVVLEGASLWVDAPAGELLRTSDVYEVSQVTDAGTDCGDPRRLASPPVLLTSSSCGRGRGSRRRRSPSPPERGSPGP